MHHALEPLVSGLKERLSARDPVVRGHAMLVCARLRLPDGDALVAPLLCDCGPDVRVAAAGSLAWLATDGAAIALIGALADREFPPERL
ncbi:MAG: HEAT repeat domain-containing protein [Solirubrobacteraceae bacterium]